MSDLVCVKCGGRIGVYYTDPLTYVCDNRICRQAYQDIDYKRRVLTYDEARARRPALFGMPTCVVPGCCTHHPHGQTCLICEDNRKAKNRVPRLEPIMSHWRKPP